MNPLTARIRAEIPIAAALQVSVESETRDHVVIRAPLRPNMNIKKTAFGGSLNAIATLACWTLVTRAAEEAGDSVDYLVIQDSSVSFLKPVSADFEAEARWPTKESRSKFIAALSKRKLARAKVEAVIRTQGGKEVLVVFTGRFVAQAKALTVAP